MATIANPTKLADFNAGFLPPPVTDYIFERAANQSVVMQLAQRVPLAFQGTAVPYVTTRPQGAWVAEGALKSKTVGGINLKTLTPKKLTAIMVDSMEVVRANPGGYVTRMQDLLAEAFALAFDAAALHNTLADGTGTGPFATYLDQATKTSEIGTSASSAGGVYADLNSAMAKVVGSKDATGRRRRLTGFALDAVLEPVIRGSVDTTGNPIFIDLATDGGDNGLAQPGRILGRQSFMGEGVATSDLDTVVGYAGDFTQAAWGAIGGINYKMSTDASVTIGGSLVSLYENNLVAFLAEAEYGFLLNDVDAIVKLTNTNNTPTTSA